MSRWGQAAIAILVAGAVLVLAAWLDTGVVGDAQRDAAANFDSSALSLTLSLGSLAVASSVLLLAVVAWRSHSVLVGAAYALVGAFFAFLPVIVWRYAAQINDTPPVLPQPITDAVNQVYYWSAGPLNAVETIGAGMLLIGVVVIGRSMRGRSVRRASEPLAGIEAQPIRP